jgi:hypothetical protein
MPALPKREGCGGGAPRAGGGSRDDAQRVENGHHTFPTRGTIIGRRPERCGHHPRTRCADDVGAQRENVATARSRSRHVMVVRLAGTYRVHAGRARRHVYLSIARSRTLHVAGRSSPPAMTACARTVRVQPVLRVHPRCQTLHAIRLAGDDRVHARRWRAARSACLLPILGRTRHTSCVSAAMTSVRSRRLRILYVLSTAVLHPRRESPWSSA